MQSQGLFASVALDFGIQWAAWAVAALLKTETFYDAIGSVTFLTLALRSLLFGVAAAQPRSRLVTGLVCAWALRLGTFLVRRIRKDGGRDSRFDGVRDKPAKFLAFWTIQGVWVALTLLPCLLLNDTAAQPPLGWTDALGARPTCASLPHAPLHSRPGGAWSPHPIARAGYKRRTADRGPNWRSGSAARRSAACVRAARRPHPRAPQTASHITCRAHAHAPQVWPSG